MRVVLVDDHQLVREGLRSLIERHPAWTVCGEATNGQEAVDLISELRPDLVVLDLSMPVMNGIQAATKIRQVSPLTKIIMLSMHDSSYAIQEAERAGVDLFLSKSAAGTELIQAIDKLFGHTPQ